MLNTNNIWEQVRIKKNVNGMSQVIQKKIVNGQKTNIDCIRIYVTKKLPLGELTLHDTIPKLIDNIRTDVVEIGQVKALQVDKTAKRRPVDIGVSVGHWNITAGSLGMHYMKDGKLYIGSNAHIVTPSANLPVGSFEEKRITQPGPYHIEPPPDNGDDENGICPFANAIVKILNYIAKSLGRRTRLGIIKVSDLLTKEECIVGEYFWHSQVIPSEQNVQDFGVYIPSVEHIDTIADESVDKNAPFIGHLFAGDDTTGIICKVKYAIENGFIPIVPIAEVVEDDTVHGVSFWCNYTTKVIDRSALIEVWYGDFSAVFIDQIVVKNNGTIIGGWSGSGWRKL